MTAKLTEAFTEAFATAVAVIVCNPAGVPGVNKPDVLMVPVVAFPPVFPSTCQVTPEFVGSLNTMAVNCCVSEVVMEPRLGLTVTVSVPCVSVIVAALDLVVSVTEDDVRVTVAGLGNEVGPV